MIRYWARVQSEEPTSGLEPLTCSLRVITQALQGPAQGCKCPYLGGFLCSWLRCVAPYCAPGGVRVVSTLFSYLPNNVILI
jgi:hypothetical protein